MEEGGREESERDESTSKCNMANNYYLIITIIVITFLFYLAEQ